jgi:hypothetical protein
MTDESRSGHDGGHPIGTAGTPALPPATDYRVSYAMPRECYILYKNWRGEVGWRRVMPHEILFGSTPWHREPQWLLRATDLEKGAERHFALSDVQLWGRPAKLGDVVAGVPPVAALPGAAPPV